MGLAGQCGLTIQSLTFPLTATGLSTMACIPRIADWGGLMIGVPIIEPNTPPLEMVKVPPSMSSIASSFVRAWEETKPRQRNLVDSTIVKNNGMQSYLRWTLIDASEDVRLLQT